MRIGESIRRRRGRPGEDDDDDDRSRFSADGNRFDLEFAVVRRARKTPAQLFRRKSVSAATERRDNANRDRVVIQHSRTADN